MNPEKIENALRYLRGDPVHFRELLTDSGGILKNVCKYAEYQAKRKGREPWSIIGEITGHGRGVSSAIYEIYKE